MASYTKSIVCGYVVDEALNTGLWTGACDSADLFGCCCSACCILQRPPANGHTADRNAIISAANNKTACVLTLPPPVTPSLPISRLPGAGSLQRKKATRSNQVKLVDLRAQLHHQVPIKACEALHSGRSSAQQQAQEVVISPTPHPQTRPRNANRTPFPHICSSRHSSRWRSQPRQRCRTCTSCGGTTGRPCRTAACPSTFLL